MLFSPPPPLSAQPVSSSAKDDSSPPPPPSLPPTSLSASHTPSESDVRCIETRPRAVSSSYNATLITNGPPHNRSLSTSQSRFSQLPDQDWFDSSPLPSSVSRPSVHHLVPTSSKMPTTKSSSTNRRESCPVPRSENKKENRFRFPSSITSSIRDSLVTSTSTPTATTTNPNVYTNEIAHMSRTSLPGCKRPTNIFLPVANPVAAAALMEDDESEMIGESSNKSITPTLLDSPKSSARTHRTPTEYSTSIAPSHHYTSKAILNVGGVRHEGNAFFSLI